MANNPFDDYSNPFQPTGPPPVVPYASSLGTPYTNPFQIGALNAALPTLASPSYNPVGLPPAGLGGVPNTNPYANPQIAASIAGFRQNTPSTAAPGQGLPPPTINRSPIETFGKPVQGGYQPGVTYLNNGVPMTPQQMQQQQQGGPQMAQYGNPYRTSSANPYGPNSTPPTTPQGPESQINPGGPGYAFQTPNGPTTYGQVPPSFAQTPTGQASGQAGVPGAANSWGLASREDPNNYMQNWLYQMGQSGLGPLSGTPGSALASHMAARAMGQYIAQSILGQGGASTTPNIQGQLGNPQGLMGGIPGGAGAGAAGAGGNFGGANNALASVLGQLSHNDLSQAGSSAGQALMQLMQDPQQLQDYVLGQTGYGFGSQAFASMLPTLLKVAQAGGSSGPLGSVQAALKLLGINVPGM